MTPFQIAMPAARAAVVPVADQGPTIEPVTIGGWYQIKTVSGRPAWAKYTWRAGRLETDVVTYDRDAEEALESAAADDEVEYRAWRTEQRLRNGVAP